MIRENGVGLSGGQKQTLLLARIILRSPNILLLDEPTASLDETTERTVIQNLKEWSAGRTVIIATHRYPVLDLVDRVIVINNGAVALDGPKAEVFAKLSDEPRSRVQKIG
jgi:ATP-binding cassette subfamily C protein LapB